MDRGAVKRAALGLGLALFCALVQAKVATISLQELAKTSDLILFGEVEQVEVKGGVKVAFVRVGSVYKGRVDGPIAFVAEPTWTCDISSATPGEPVLLYLSDLKPIKGKTMEGQDLGAAKTACKREGVRLMLIAHSGRGKIPLLMEHGRWMAPVTTGEGKGPGLNVNLYVPTPVPTVQTSKGGRAILLAELLQRTQKAMGKGSGAVGV